MDASGIKDLFLDMIGGTSLEDVTVDKIYENGIKLLNQYTAHVGADFINDHTVVVLLAMQVQYDLVQRNYDDADKGLKALIRFTTEITNDTTQDEQVDQVNHMGDQ